MGVPREALSDGGPVHRLPQHGSTCHCILPSPDVCILALLILLILPCNVVCPRKSRWSPQPFRKVPSSLLLQPPALFRQFNSSTPDALLCRASASSGLTGARRKKRVEHLLRLSHCTPSPPSRVADAGHMSNVLNANNVILE